jgi:hypothetical protein
MKSVPATFFSARCSPRVPDLHSLTHSLTDLTSLTIFRLIASPQTQLIVHSASLNRRGSSTNRSGTVMNISRDRLARGWTACLNILRGIRVPPETRVLRSGGTR